MGGRPKGVENNGAVRVCGKNGPGGSVEEIECEWFESRSGGPQGFLRGLGVWVFGPSGPGLRVGMLIGQRADSKKQSIQVLRSLLTCAGRSLSPTGG